MTRVCCIVGLAPSTRLGYMAEPPGVDIWTVNNAFRCFTPEQIALFTGWFQIHPREEWERNNADELKAYQDFLKGLKIPVYMDASHEDYPTSVKYPLEELIQDLGADYFTSSIAYMIALAIYQKYDELHLYGIEMVYGTEYINERPCVEFWLGVAHARGMKLIMPEASTLLRGPLYGRQVSISSTTLKNALEIFTRSREERRALYNTRVGIVDALTSIGTMEGFVGNDLIKKQLEQALKDREVAKSEFNAFAGASWAMEEVLIDAIRPEREDHRTWQIKGQDLEPENFTPSLFRDLVDSVHGSAPMNEAGTLVLKA